MSYIVHKVEHKDLQAYLDEVVAVGYKLTQVIDGNIEYTVVSECWHSPQEPAPAKIKAKKKYDY